MRELTMQELFKVLPLNEEMRTELLTKYDSYPDDEKVEIIHVCYKAFHQMLQVMKEAKNEKFMEEVAEGKRSLSSDFNQQIEDAVWEDIEGNLTGKPQEENQLDDVRRQLQSLISPSTH